MPLVILQCLYSLQIKGDSQTNNIFEAVFCVGVQHRQAFYYDHYTYVKMVELFSSTEDTEN
jgi:hypothetical protein